uniref:Uncharacterized protein n=1 Tax=Anguilla anguilla TaxID=7936 RepID=A0A0E9VH18_ANGAN
MPTADHSCPLCVCVECGYFTVCVDCMCVYILSVTCICVE